MAATRWYIPVEFNVQTFVVVESDDDLEAQAIVQAKYEGSRLLKELATPIDQGLKILGANGDVIVTGTWLSDALDQEDFGAEHGAEFPGFERIGPGSQPRKGRQARPKVATTKTQTAKSKAPAKKAPAKAKTQAKTTRGATGATVKKTRVQKEQEKASTAKAKPKSSRGAVKSA